MRFTISPCTAQGDTVFLIYDEAGEVRYRVTRSKKPAGAVLLLTDSQGTAASYYPVRNFAGGGEKSQRYLADFREWDSPAIGFGRGHLAFPGRFGGAEF